MEHQLLANIRTAFGYAYFYGPDFYQRMTDFIQRTVPTYVCPTYAYFDQLFLYGKIADFLAQQ
jgi:hypothetical protein